MREFFAGYPIMTASFIFALIIIATVIVARLFCYELTFPITFFEFNRQYPYLLLAMTFGASVGAAEIASRYRDEPFLAIMSPPGRSYLAFNAIISLAAFCLLARYPGFFGFDTGSRDFLIMSIVAGFGAMVVMRSKLFTLKNDNGEPYAVGPDAVINIFLSSMDRNIDRHRSFTRQRLVYEEAIEIGTPEAAANFIKIFLASYQNLSEDEKRSITVQIDALVARDDLTRHLKLMSIGFGFLNLSGDRNFKELMGLLRKYEQLLQPESGGSSATPVTPVPPVTPPVPPTQPAP